MGALKQVWQKGRGVRPGRIARDARLSFRLRLRGADAEDRERLSRVFVGAELSREQQALAVAHIAPNGGGTEVVVRSPRVGGEEVAVDWVAPEAGLAALLQRYGRYRLALARVFPALRPVLARQLIIAVASRNAAVAAVSALPEVIPTPLSLVLALGEMGSDTVLITVNQMALCFELAAMRGEAVGWRAQAAPLAGIVAAALGWRTLARELVGLIPAGIGVSAKAAIAFGGTMAVGKALWRGPGIHTQGDVEIGPTRGRVERWEESA
ncbi:MAG: hypothetical protein ACRD01_08990 [Terriglobales bacterium]